MRILYTVICGILASVLLVFIHLMKRTDTAVNRSLWGTYICAFLVITSNIGIALSETWNLSMFFHIIFFVSITFLLLFYLVFCERYILKKTGIISKIFFGFAIVDGIQLVLNFFTHHAFTMKDVTYMDEHYVTFTSKLPYQLHIVFCYVIIAVGFLYLIYAIIHSPSFYKIKYFYVIGIMILVGIFDGFYLYFAGTPINWSVVAYPFCVVTTYYFLIVFATKRLRHESVVKVCDAMTNGLLIVDYQEEIIYVNSYFTEYFKENDVKELMNSWLHGKGFEVNDFSRDMVLDTEEGEKFFHLEYRKSESKRKKDFLGASFIVVDLTKEVQRIESEHYKATHDALTDIYSREYFYTKAQECLKSHKNEDYVLLVNDIGNFKFINDMFGTTSADFILKQFGVMLKKYANREDDVFGRLDNDHFALLMPKKRYHEQLFLEYPKTIMEVLDKQMGSFFICYIGVYEIKDNTSIQSMCDKVKLAIKTIKGTTQRIVYYKEDMSNTVLFEQELTGYLSKAIQEDQIKLFVQPQVNPKGEILGGEALVRWQHPEKGMIMPGIFIPLFERNGRISEIDAIIWEKACQTLSKWKSTGLENYYLSVNISPKDLLTLDIYEIFTSLVTKYDISPKNLKLEITETAIMQNFKATEELIERLKSFGFIIEMDDFGSGYSSLNMLKDITVDVIKLDMAFLRKTDHPEKARCIIESIVSLAKKLELGIITEGVETKEHVDFLTGVGCDVFQGYYFAKPMPLESFEEKIKE